MTDLRYIAERWIAQYGPETPRMVAEWASQLEGAPTAATQFLSEIAEVARGLLEHPPAGQAGDLRGQLKGPPIDPRIAFAPPDKP